MVFASYALTATLPRSSAVSVALARAPVHDPQLLLLDEPLGALDALARIEMQLLIETLWGSGFTAVLVTHDAQEAIALADRIVLIENGRIALDEPILLPRPLTHGNPAGAQIAERILARLLRHPASATGLPQAQALTVSNMSQAGFDS